MANKENELIPQAVMEKAVAQANGGTANQNQQPSYAGTFDGQLQEIYDKITNRPDFQYDVNADPLYGMYKDQFIQNGKLAMKDAMGQAAALTGGYGSTYGQQVGQQTYDAYLKDFGSVIPELYGMAYDMYRDKGDDLLKQYGLLGDMRDTEYGRYRDELEDWNYQQELARQKEETEYNRQQDQEKTAYSRQQQAYANLVALIKASGYQPTDAELAAAGLTREAASALQQEYTRSITPQTTGSSGSGGGGGGGGGYRSGSDIAALQRQLNAMGENLSVDGIYGPLTQAAAARHGLSIGSSAYKPTTSGSTGTSGTTAASYNFGELMDAAAAGASKSQIEAALRARGVDTTRPGVQADINKALSK